ncbi:hypothetical protein OUZ56_017447 [Daphnia magna]|uniref:Uncharacterized protein n=1 Tax=Daphnia magna TaxID=35525 RepID=A0ABR0ASU2_9CRUS|nr:hypothetical protein OUZ56_017447 [Daphnia magna]
MVLGTLEEITLAEESTDSEGEVLALAASKPPKWSREVFGNFVSKEIGVEAEHAIETGDCRPIRQSPYSSAWKERELMRTLVQELEDAGVIEKCNGP